MEEKQNMPDYEAMLPKDCSRTLNLVKAYGEEDILRRMLESGVLKLRHITKDAVYNFETHLTREAETKEKIIEESIPDEG